MNDGRTGDRPRNRGDALRTLEHARGVMVPTVVESSERGERHFGIFDRLLRDRIVFLGQEIDDQVANVVIAQLLFLESEDPDREIVLYINSPGGVVYSGLAIYDTMRHLRSPVATLCVGMAASMAAALLVAGEKGRRSALPNARILIHQPHGGAQGQATDIEIQVREVRHLKDTVTGIFASACDKPPEVLAEVMERDNYMSPAEAVAYGLIDQVLSPRERPSSDQGASRTSNAMAGSSK